MSNDRRAVNNPSRYLTLRIFVIVCFAAIAAKLFYIQIVDPKYKASADSNVLRYEVQYPPRGEILDRNGQFLVQSKEAYDLMVVPHDVMPFDTALMASILGTTNDDIAQQIEKARRYSPYQASVVYKLLTKQTKLRLEEMSLPGFYLTYRTVRSYPRNVAGNLLGYIGEVSDKTVADDPYYHPGDYIGMSGIEQAYEDVLRGKKGVKINMVDVRGVSRGSYRDGMYDTIPEVGPSITCTIDANLQAFGEELMAGKVGSIVAIEPSTGEILMMVSSPTYNPDELVGSQRGNNYMKLVDNKRMPLFNRAVMASYPPGSTFKLINGLIGLQEGAFTTETRYPCHNGYHNGKLTVKCHTHPSPLMVTEAVQMSCNSYFCYAFRAILDNRRYKGGVREGFDTWRKYVNSFGFGRKLDSDFPGELRGNVPSPAYYDRKYRGQWNSLTIISLAIGQGEMGCTPMQMANLAATVANRGYYYIPHVVKAIEGRDSIDRRFYERHTTLVDRAWFDPIVEGMHRAVSAPGGTAGIARIDGIDVCGKTGTAQNPHGPDHSTFLCFAPRNNPRIAISVYVENGGFGATIAAPIASLLVEKYLTGDVKRKDLVQYVESKTINYPAYAH